MRAAAADSTERQETKQAAAKQRLLPRDATGCNGLQPAEVELDGLEQGHQASGKSNILPQGGTVDAENSRLDPQLQLLIQRWPTLSPEIQQQIMQSLSFFVARLLLEDLQVFPPDECLGISINKFP